MAASSAPAAAVTATAAAPENEDSERQPQREEAAAVRGSSKPAQSGAAAMDEKMPMGNADGGYSGGGGRGARGGRGGSGLSGGGGEFPSLARGASDAVETRRWRMASRRAEASLADLRETLGDVLSLSFQCGQECARRGEAATGAGSSPQSAAAAAAAPGGGGDGVGGGAGEDGEGGSHGVENRGEVVDVAAAAVTGDAGSCCAKRRCVSCEARVTAAEELLNK